MNTIAEVDLILEINNTEFAIEIKASTNIGKIDLSGLESFSEISNNNPIKLVIYEGEYSRKIGDTSILALIQAMKLIVKLIASYA